MTFRDALERAQNANTREDELVVLRDIADRLKHANSALAVDSAWQILDVFIRSREER